MPLKRLRKAGDAGPQKPAVQFLEEAVESERASKQRKAPESDRLRPAYQRKQTDHLSQACPSAKSPRPPPPAAVSKPAAQSQPSSRSLSRGISDDLAASDSGLYGPDQSSDEEETFEERSDDRANDPACIQCDDGGDIMFCDGSCMRAVHCGVQHVAPDADGSNSDDSDASEQKLQLVPSECNPLRMPLDLYQHLKDTKDVFHCPNCLTGVHQCFKCKKEGVEAAHQADPKNRIFAERLVVRCGVASCGRFYHANCMNLTKEDMNGAFFCPLHSCKHCGEDHSTPQNELIPCRRCPKAYHEHCMPQQLCSPLDEKKSRSFKQRVWRAQFDDAGNCTSEVERSLIYCTAHKIQSDRDNPEHTRDIFHKILLQRWQEHFAQAFPDLESSKIVRKQMEDEDVPLAQRKRPSSADATPALRLAAAPSPASKLFQASTPQTAVAQQAKHAAKQAAQEPAVHVAATTGPARQSSGEQAKSKSASLAQAVSKQTAAKPNALKASVSSKQGQAVRPLDSKAAKLQRKSSSKGAMTGTQVANPKQQSDGSEGSQVADPKRQSDGSEGKKPASSAAVKGGLSFLDAPKAQKGGDARAAAVPDAATSMGPPPNRKRPALPDRSALPPKKRRAVPADEVRSKNQHGVVSTDSKPTESGQGVGASHSRQLAKATNIPAGATTTSASTKPSHPVPSSKAAVEALAPVGPATAPSARFAVDTSKDAGQTPGLDAEPQSLAEHHSPVQIVHQEDVGDVDIADDFGPAIDVSQEAADADADASGGATNQAETDTADADANAGPPTKAAAGHAQAAPSAAVVTKTAKRSHTTAFAAAAEAGAKAQGRNALKAAARSQGDAAEATESGKAAGLEDAQAAAPPADATGVAGVPAAPPRPIDVPHEFARQLRQASLEQRKAEAANRVQEIMSAGPSLQQVLQRVKATTRQPEPYSQPSKSTISEERLKAAEQAVANALKHPTRAKYFVDSKYVRELLMHQDNMSMVLAPFLHGKRYSSYGRHFTKEHLLKTVAQLLSFYLHDGDTIVDFSCGANAFVPLVKKEGAKQGLTLKGRAFDIITSQNLEDFERSSWMDTRRGQLPPGDTLVIGLNPPFGKNNQLARKFMEHAADQFRPRVIVLIVPPSTPIPRNYVVMYEDCTTMSDRSFYVPGATAESWNLITPALRVLLRQDWVGRLPRDGSGWYPTPHAGPPRYGSRRRPPSHLMQPPFAPHMPQQPQPWQQRPNFMPPQPMHQQAPQQQQQQQIPQQLPQYPWQQPHGQQFPLPWQQLPEQQQQQHMSQQGPPLQQPPVVNPPQHAFGTLPWHHGHQR